jgi:PAS domain S-box-containing protein
LSSGTGESHIASAASEDVLEAALDAIFTIDAEGSVVYMNRAAEEMFGLERDHARGRLLAELVMPPDQHPGHWERLAKAAADDRLAGVGRRRETRGRRSDGSEFPVEVTVTTSSMSPRRYTSFVRDLSLIKEGERRRNRMETILSKAEQLVGMGSFELDLRTRELVWSDELFRINGYEPGEVVPTIELAVERMHPEDRAEIQARTATMFESPRAMRAEYRIQHDDGTIRHVIADGTVELGEDEEPLLLVGAVQDVTEERMNERDLRSHHALTEALRDWHSFDEGVVELIRRLCTAMEWDVGSLWVRADRRADLLVCRAIWSDPVANLAAVERSTRELTYERGVSTLWTVWERQRPLTLVDLETSRKIEATDVRDEAVAGGIRSMLMFPAVHKGETLALVMFGGREPRSLTEGFLSTLESLGGDLGRFLSRRRAEIGMRKLSQRELQILRLAADGHSAPQIAERLEIGPATVKTHFAHTYEKLGVSDRSAAVAEAMRQGLFA